MSFILLQAINRLVIQFRIVAVTKNNRAISEWERVLNEVLSIFEIAIVFPGVINSR